MPLTAAQRKFQSTPQSYTDFAPEYYLKRGEKAIEKVSALLTGNGEVDIEMVASVQIPLETTMDSQIFQSKPHKQKARANDGQAHPRKRSEAGMGFVHAVYSALPTEASARADYGTKEICGARMKKTVSYDGGTLNVTGRFSKMAPHIGSTVARPPTKREVATAIFQSGCDLSGVPSEFLKALPLSAMGMNPDDPYDGIYINPKADSGYPVNVKIDVPGALEKIQQLAIGMREDAERAYARDKVNGVENLIREWQEVQPHLVVLKGKCKADCYSLAKVENFEMRFYNALGRQCGLNMQVATQVLEANAKSILGMAGGRSAQSVSLVRGGAEDLVGAMDAQLLMEDCVYVHVGDDSWVAVKVDGGIVLFSLDCSSFDITQHNQATAEIDWQIREQLERIDPVAAQFWYAFIRERLIVMHGWATYKWKHGGPSGMMLQSKRNDILMDVVLQRVAQIAHVAKDKDKLDVELQKIGKDLHLHIRLEDYAFCPGRSTIADALKDTAFLFIGYRFYNERGGVEVYCDLPRSLAQFPFPALKWTVDNQDFAVQEAIRLGSTVLNMGTPPSELEKAHNAGIAYVENLIRKAIRSHGDVEDERLRWAVQHNPHGTDPVPSLSGVLRAIGRRDQLWKRPELATSEFVDELLATSAFAPAEQWADILDEEDRQRREVAKVKELNYAVNPALARLKALRTRARKPPTHPVTLANLGRQGPTAVWAPDKPKARRFTESRSKGFSRGVSHQEEDFYDNDSDRASEYSDYGMDE